MRKKKHAGLVYANTDVSRANDDTGFEKEPEWRETKLKTARAVENYVQEDTSNARVVIITSWPSRR